VSTLLTDILIDLVDLEKCRFSPDNTDLSDHEKKTLVEHIKIEIQQLPSDTVDYNLSCKGYVFRGHKQESITGTYHALRRVSETIMSLNELKMPESFVKTLSDKCLCSGGLILVSGMTGSGKSTTIASLLLERLKLFGGMAITIENPVEAMLSGEHGKGFCIQTAVSSEAETHVALRGALRCFPSKQQQGILLIGEIRDSYTALHALNAALSGHLVIATLHGSDIIASLRRMISVASSDSSENEALSLLSQTMRVTIHQRYENGIHKFVMLANNNASSAIGQHIASGSMEKLSTAIQQQANKSMSGQILWSQ